MVFLILKSENKTDKKKKTREEEAGRVLQTGAKASHKMENEGVLSVILIAHRTLNSHNQGHSFAEF